MGLSEVIMAETSRIGIWSIDEIENGMACDAESDQQRSRPQYSLKEAKRQAVSTILETFDQYEKIGYTPNGRPYFVNNSVSISISHADHFIVVAIDNEKSIGVDIERVNRKYKAIASKYLSELELSWLDTNCNNSMSLSWCIKEAAYKLPWRSTKFPSRDISIVPFTKPSNSGQMEARVDDKGKAISLPLHYRFFHEHCLVWLSAEKSIFSESGCDA